jgi:hypothetical protein
MVNAELPVTASVTENRDLLFENDYLLIEQLELVYETNRDSP